ncbi:hypothetical protein B0181_00210 [Moraxella caviae]|uniref:Para-aminobenzoate synthase component 1 n=1 Tax=Moraxella caviae TaxID=34060 RepID=A0A1T0ACN4_9GAMM|nr:anthranilate synthase component I family protein [Moraxella caviae]OOR93513.1 hypothetical protein B0181_00210 [Moraxella caviae]STZ10343.1 Para-aminobenzoate synthase component 1 [Moraxella caviae]VEW10427.1 Para-aminobenzoate synthase component 1 [Moraxella caviae]VEW14194.1 Para-aminobenzoate synthase component 1 [Moraxella caviae]
MHTLTIHSTLDSATLTSLIAAHFPAWQVCYLHNDGKAVIGILPKRTWTLLPTNDTLTLHTSNRSAHLSAQNLENPYDFGQAHQSSYDDLRQTLQTYSDNFTTPSPSAASHYHHGLMGFIGYDVAANALNPAIAIKDDQPAAFFGHYDITLTPLDASANQGFMLTIHDLANQSAANQSTNSQAKTQNLAKLIAHAINGVLKNPAPNTPNAKFHPAWQKQDYQAAFERTQQYLHAGDAYQVNLTQRWDAEICALHAYLPALSTTMKAPFAGFLCCPAPTDGVNLSANDLKNGAVFELLSVSPELFFTFSWQDGAHHITTKPIKGTRPRHADASLDDKLKNELAASEKDISENLMIVDLLRNDLGKYAGIGAVRTPQKFAIESFENVHHMVSTITATISADHAPLDVLFGSLPAGSITGAPKKRACELIDELEISARGAYCGTLGFLNFDGAGQWNVLIRTLQATHSKAQLWAGGGVTVRSDGDGEYQECFDKVGAIIDVFAKIGK